MKKGDIYRNNNTKHLAFILDGYAFDIEGQTKDVVIFRRYNTSQSKSSVVKRYTCHRNFFKENYTKLTKGEYKQLLEARVKRIERGKLKYK